jgi:NTE family protein
MKARQNSMTKKALVLSGGGSKGAWQLGVLKKLMGEQGNDYEILTGVSVGALNAAGLAQTKLGNPELAVEWLINFWLEKVTSTKAIHKSWKPFGKLMAPWKPSIFDSRPLHKLFKDNFDQQLVIDSGRKIAVGTVSMDTGEVRYARETDDNFADWVLASSSYPVFLTPLEIEGQLWSDGGVKEVTPIGEAIRMGADEIDILITEKNLFKQRNWHAKSKSALPNQMLRTIALMSHRIMLRDIQVTGLKNELTVINPKYKHIKMRIILPSEHLVDDSLEFDPKEIRKMIEIGYHDADHFIEYE